jgi:anhydro-N-acetylmuramic acid kinase
MRLEDALATLTYFTAQTIADGYRRWIPHRLSEVIVSGGGVANRTLMHHLARELAPAAVRPISDYGLPVQAKEPVAFAYFALRCIRGESNHLPETTGACAGRVLGKITPG